jgi:hypothetical protein
MDDFPAPALPGSGLALVPALTKLNFVTWIYGTPISASGLSACTGGLRRREVLRWLFLHKHDLLGIKSGKLEN